MYGCETWSLTLKEKLRKRVFENKILRKIFGHKMEGTAKNRTEMCSEKFHDF
jgi:hypothetical protein